MNKYYSKKLLKNSYYGTFNVDCSSTNNKRTLLIKRRNKLRKIYDLNSEIEDETQGYIYLPFTITATAPKYYASIDVSNTPGIEPSRSQIYIRKIKKSEN